jgi:exosortase F-associated protein
MPKISLQSGLWIASGSLGLLAAYLFQEHLNVYNAFFGTGSWKMPYHGTDYYKGPAIEFIVNKSFRYVLNDAFAIALIHGIFNEARYTRFALGVFGFGMFVLLPVYFTLYLNRPEGFSSMLSHLHRLVFNPVLMMLLIPAFWNQRRREREL